VKMPVSFSTLLQAFFAEHLVTHKGASPETIDSYRDTFRLLLRFLHKAKGTHPAELRIADLDAPDILAFLDDFERRGRSVRSRNVRLAAIRSFFRFVVFRAPESAAVASRVLAVPVKKSVKRIVGYLTRSEMKALLAAPNRSTWSGRRDYAMLLTFYNTGARLSELTSLRRDQVRLGSSSFVHLLGKGRKNREVPLWGNTAHVLRAWFDEISADIVFPSARGGALSGDGVAYILRSAIEAASTSCPSLATRRITTHQLRHTTGSGPCHQGTCT